MRKVNSKALLQPAITGNGSTAAMSPSQTKPQSMIKLYKVQSQPQSYPVKVSVNMQASALIAKNIQAKRQQNINQNGSIHNKSSHNITIAIQPDMNNNSVQTVKPSNIFSPGDAILRKNETISIQNRIPQNKQSPQIRQKLFQQTYEQTQSKQITNELYNNMQKQLHKQRSLQSLFNTSQKLGSPLSSRPQASQTSKPLRNNQQPSVVDNQRATIKRGSKFNLETSNLNITLNQSSALEHSQKGSRNKFVMFKNNLTSMTRNKSAYLNFNSTQPVNSQNKTLLDSRSQDKFTVELAKNHMIHNQSPSVSSGDEKEYQERTQAKDVQNLLKGVNKETVNGEPPKMSSHQKKRSQLPNGSFIETKMKNCLHSRNNEQSTNSYQTCHVNSTQRTLLQKNQSQPSLHQSKKVTLTQRTTFVKTSFLKNDSRSVTPINALSNKSPHGQSTKEGKLSSKSKTNQIQVLKGDMKSLNLSPIIPQNLGKLQQQFQRENSKSGSNRATIASAQKRLEMRKQSIKSNNNNNGPKPYSSMKKEKSLNAKDKKQTLKDEPTTEKKVMKKNSGQTVQHQKHGYSSQETERAPGATHSFSTADDFNLGTTENAHYFLRMKKEQGKTKTLIQNDNSKHYKSNIQFTEMAAIQDEEELKQMPIFNRNEVPKIKMTQILNNNKFVNQNRYNLNLTPDQMIVGEVQHIPKIATNTKTPKSLPYNGDDTLTFNDDKCSNIKPIFTKEDDRTVKKNQNKEDTEQKKKTSNSFDEEEDMPDAKDFEEFDMAEQSEDSSSNSFKVRVQVMDQDLHFNKARIQKNNMTYKINDVAPNQGSQLSDYLPKDDRNSLVNYDTSLLTHNTGRDRNSSPISELKELKLRQSKKLKNNCHIKEYISKQKDDTFVVAANIQQDQEEDVQYTKTDDQFYEQDNIQIYTEEGEEAQDSYDEEYIEAVRKSHKYKQMLIKIQKDEENEVEMLTQDLIQSSQYKRLANDKEKAKLLSQQIALIRNKYKRILIDNVLSKQ